MLGMKVKGLGMSEPKRAKDASNHREKMLMCKQEEAGIQLNAEQADWKDDTNDESDDQELEAHYMYMAKIKEVSPDVVDSRPIFDTEPEQKNDEDADLAKERELLASLIKELKCEIDESKNRNKFLETSNKIKLYKTREDKELEKVIELENKVKVLDNIVYKTGQSVQTMHMLNNKCRTNFAKPKFLKKAKRADPHLYDIGCYNDNLALMLALESDEVIRLEKESRSKLSDLIKPFDYFKLNNLYDLFVPQREKSSEQRYFSERSRMSHIHVQNEKRKESFNKQTTLLEKQMDKSIPLVKICQSSLEIVKVKTNINTIITGVELCKQKIANRTYIGYIDPFIKNTIEQNFCHVISRINAGINLFLKCLNEEMVVDLRYFNSLELEVDSLTSQLETQRTQFVNKIDRLSREYYYVDHMNAIIGVYTELDEDTSENSKFPKQPTVENLSKVGEINALSKQVTSSSVSTPQESKGVNNDKVIAPGMFRINPDKTSREAKNVPNSVRASNRTKSITVSQPPVFTKKNVNSDLNDLSSTGVDNTKTRRPQPRSNTKNDRVPSASKNSRRNNKEAEVKEHHRNLLLSKNNKHISSACNNIKIDSQDVISKVVCAMCKKCLIFVNHDKCLRNYVIGKNSYGKKQKAMISFKENQMKYQPKVTKPRKVGTRESLATPKPRKSRLLLRWSPTGKLFDQEGKIVDSSESDSQSDRVNGDNACTSNSLEPKIKRFPNSTSLLDRLFRFVYGHNLFSVGQFYDSDLEAAFRRNACFIRNLEGVDLLKGDRSPNLYTINLHEMASASPICLMAQASFTKSWLWHQRLSHLNFDTINDLARNDLVAVHFLRSKDKAPAVIITFLKRITVLLQSPVIIIRTNNGTEFKNQLLKEYFDTVGISHQMSYVRTPQQNGVVERRNWTLVEAARTTLIFSRASLFLWAEAIATACFTQNRSIIHRRFSKPPYELINSRKPDISFHHVFDALCYPKNDREDIGKLGAKGFIYADHPSHVYKLKKALYGLKQAPRAWYDELSMFLLQNHFFKGTIDPTQFIRRFFDDILVVQVYVDDIIIGSTHPRYIQLFFDLVKSHFEMSMMGEMTFFLGLQVNQSPCGIFINQSKYVLEILNKYGVESCDPVGTPMEIKDKIDLDQNGTPVDATKYRSLIGALMYLMSSRPDIVHATCLCDRYQAKTTEKHLKEVKWIFHYLLGIVNTGLWYTKDSGFELTGFLDADYTGCKDTFKSTSSGAQFFGEKLVSWSLKKQDYMALLTAKAEYVSISACCAKVLWMRTQLTDYCFHFNKIPIYYDSKSAIAISCNPVQHSRTKHIAIRYHFIMEHVEKGTIQLYFVKTDYQLADIFTKALPADRFNYLVRRLVFTLTNGNPSRVNIKQLRGRIRRWRYNLTPVESKFKTPMLDHQDKHMMKAQVHVSKSSVISDVQPLPQRKHYCQNVKSIKWLERIANMDLLVYNVGLRWESDVFVWRYDTFDGDVDKEVPIFEGSPVTRTKSQMETYKTVSQDIRDQLNAKAEAVQIILTRIDNDIYSTVDACPNACPMWKHQNEVNEIRVERIARTANQLALFAQQQPVYHPQNHPTQYTKNSSTRAQQDATRNRGKAIVNSFQPIYDQEPSMVAEDDETSKDKEIDKLMALISLSVQKIYKPTNNNLRTSSNTRRANQDNSLRINRGTGDATDDELEDQELEAHYMYMAKLQEVSPDAADSGPIFDAEPLQKVSNDDHYNVFAIESEHPEQLESIHDTYPIEQDEHNMIIDSLDMSYDREQIDQNDDDDDLVNERELLASLIKKLKCEIDDIKNHNKFLETSNKVLIEKLKSEIEDFKNKNKCLESSNNRFKEAHNKLSETNNLLYTDFKKSQAELARRNSVEYALKVEIDVAKARGDLISYKMESPKSYNKYTQAINDLNHTISEMKKKLCAHQETISILSQPKEAQIKLYKTREDKELDKVIDLENKVKKTQFLNEIDRLSREYYYADHMNAILGVYTELDEVTNLQCNYLELLEKCECLEKELSKSKMMSKTFEALWKHAINLEIDLQQCQEKIKNDKSFKVNQSKEFCKEREQYIKIQDLKAQLQDKGKPTTFLNSLERNDFSKSKSVTQNNLSNEFSKPVTAQTLPPNKKSILKKTNVLGPGIPQLKSNPIRDRVMRNNSQGKKQDVEDHHRNVKFSKNNTFVTACNDSLKAKTLNVNFVGAACGKCVLNEKHAMCVLKSINGVNSRTKMPIVVHVSTREPKCTVKQSIAKPIRNTVDLESNQKPRNITRKLYKRIRKACIPLCQILHCLQNSFTSRRDCPIHRDSGCLKHMTGNLKILIHFMEKFLGTIKFRNDQIAPILGYRDLVQGAVTIKRVYYVEGINHNLFSIGQFCNADLEVAFQKSTCYIHDLKGNDLLTGGDKLVSWSSKKQDCTSVSSAKAEYVSLSACCTQVLWMRTQLTDYGFHFDKIPMYCDSKA
nr:retrovirus-related Pol polyprotein from transposon TNT 1-94 [Tanacetum cinerariifolium]